MTDKRRQYELKRRYGLTVDQYDTFLAEQEDCCAICRKHKDKENRRLAVDHNHKTGEIRGLLCGYCNRRIVGRHTDSDLLRRVADYLDKGTGLFVPEDMKTGRRRKRKRVKRDNTGSTPVE